MNTKKPTLADLERLARGAGQIVHDGYEQKHHVDYKGVIDPVTEVDRQSEKFLLSEIQRDFPTHRILAEESGLLSGQEEDLWYIDPLDGTVNYAHGIPIFSISIAFAHAGEMLLGVVFDPMRDELFTAKRGAGAKLNGRPLQVSRASQLKESLLVTGFPYDTWDSPRDNLENFSRFSRLTQGVRRLGSAALDSSYVAAGRFDGYWELSLSPWDIAAGSLIAAEAGARVTNIDGGADYLSSPQSIIVAPPRLHELIMETLKRGA